jgi:hypothetical protein
MLVVGSMRPSAAMVVAAPEPVPLGRGMRWPLKSCVLPPEMEERADTDGVCVMEPDRLVAR